MLNMASLSCDKQLNRPICNITIILKVKYVISAPIVTKLNYKKKDYPHLSSIIQPNSPKLMPTHFFSSLDGSIFPIYFYQIGIFKKSALKS